MKFTKNLQLYTIAASLAFPALIASNTAGAALSGNIGVFSKYVFRGSTNTAENNGTAVQGGLDYSHDSGFYAGYWASNLDYADASDPAQTGFENDFYAGYSGEAGGFSYDVGVLQYYYLSIEDADALELYGSLGYGPVSVGLTYAAEDVVWENDGDMYWTFSYATGLPHGFDFSATAGYFMYDETGEFITSSASDSGLKHVDLSLSHPVGDTGADMSITYIIGGEDRDEVDQEDTVVLGLSYGFDI